MDDSIQIKNAVDTDGVPLYKGDKVKMLGRPGIYFVEAADKDIVTLVGGIKARGTNLRVVRLHFGANSRHEVVRNAMAWERR